MQDRDLEMCVYAFVSVSEEMPFGNLVKTQAQLWIPSHLLLRIAQGERGGSAASTEQKRFMPLSESYDISILPSLFVFTSLLCLSPSPGRSTSEAPFQLEQRSSELRGFSTRQKPGPRGLRAFL